MEDNMIRQAQAGDQRAFQKLIETYHTLAWRIAQVLLSDQSAVDDVMQEVWLDVWRGLPRFQMGRPFRPWLLTIVANRCHMAFRRHRVSTLALDATEIEQFLYTEDVLEHILHQEKDRELQHALAILSTEQRCVLELRFFADLDLSEIAQITGTPLGTVKSRLHRALSNLRLYLQSIAEPCKERNR